MVRRLLLLGLLGSPFPGEPDVREPSTAFCRAMFADGKPPPLVRWCTLRGDGLGRYDRVCFEVHGAPCN